MKDNKHIQSFNEHGENLNSKTLEDTSSSISDLIKSKKSYYHLQQSDDGRFNQSSTIAWIESDTTKEERIKLADYYTNGQFTKYPGFYQLIGPIKTPFILSF